MPRWSVGPCPPASGCVLWVDMVTPSGAMRADAVHARRGVRRAGRAEGHAVRPVPAGGASGAERDPAAGDDLEPDPDDDLALAGHPPREPALQACHLARIRHPARAAGHDDAPAAVQAAADLVDLERDDGVDGVARGARA